MDFKKICFNCMKEKTSAESVCPYCGYDNSSYKRNTNCLPPLTPLNGKYILGRVLGAGGFGITYVAYDTHLQVVVAIKELYIKKVSVRDGSAAIAVTAQNKACFEENKKRFLLEARVLAKFNENDNEGIVLVKDHFEENNTAYIVMEYVDGVTLKERVAKRRLSFEETKKIMRPICHALTKVHHFGVVHLDVSPDNIIVPENKEAKLLDFGGAKTIGASDDNAITFKRGYSPLEQRLINGNVGVYTDVYSTAATIYYCLTGEKPVDAMDRQAGTKLKKLSDFGVKIPQVSEKALMRAMDMEPSKRFSSVEEFWDVFSSTSKKSEKNVKKIGIIAAAAVAAIVIVGAFLSHDHPDKKDITGPAASDVVRSESQKGETIPINLGTYIFENAADRNLIMGVDSGFGDDGTALVLKDYADLNQNRVCVTDENVDDGFYNMRAAHTNSYIETSNSQDLGEVIRQFSEMYDVGTEKWVFVYCGHDDEKDMDEVIIKNAAGSVLAPRDGKAEAGTEIVLAEYDINDDSQKWYMRWSEIDESEKPVIVYNEGDLVENISGVFNIASALDGKTSICINRDEAFFDEPTAVVFYAEWLTTADTVFEFEFVPTGNESRYKIFPVDQKAGEHKCLQFNPDTNQLFMADESDDVNQLFRIVYVQSNTYLLQAYNESVVGFDLNEEGTAEGQAVLARSYDQVEDSRLESWLIVNPHEEG